VDDYKNLGSNGLQAVVLIFLVTWFFIGFRQSLIATFAMPIAFFCTFIFLNANGSTLNFMTNFSLVLSFGMGIDTVIVIIEAAYEYMKK
jgi:multidrug efflux pump subunit AcrB